MRSGAARKFVRTCQRLAVREPVGTEGHDAVAIGAIAEVEGFTPIRKLHGKAQAAGDCAA